MTPDVENKPDSGLWKDALNEKAVKELSKQLGRAYNKFDRDSFESFIITDRFFTLELKERIFVIAEGLKKYLPKNYKSAVNILIKTAPHAGTFENWALLTFVEKYGLEHFEDSIFAMEKLTPKSTAEFAIRPFMIRYTERMMPILTEWAKNENEHIRRLAAEASRPRGVWVAHIEQFKKDPTEVLKLLELLKADRSLYVRKAVANNLNDISKEHPSLVIKTARRWLKDGSKESDWIVKHGCRSLLKKGYPGVFELFGFTSDPKYKIKDFKFNKNEFKIGDDKAVLSFDLISQKTEVQKLSIDYKVYYLKKSGNHSGKVFKLSEKSIKPKETVKFSIKHSFKNMTTRKHYAGLHKVELLVNGSVASSYDFHLK